MAAPTASLTYNETPGATHTYTYLVVDDNRNRDNSGGVEKGDRVSSDSGTYASYAGASYRRNTNGKCVRFGGKVVGTVSVADFDSRWTHCG